MKKVGDTDCTVVDVDDIWTKTDYDHVGNVTALTTAKDEFAGRLQRRNPACRLRDHPLRL